MLARISHHPSTATAQGCGLVGFRSVVVVHTTCGAYNAPYFGA